MKVLHVIPSIAAAHGGPSRAMRMIERALLDQGVELETVTTDDDGYGGRVSRPVGELTDEEGSARRYFSKTTNPYKISIGLARWISRHIAEYDVIHIHALFSFSSTVAALAARRAGVPYIIRPLGTLANYGMSKRRPFLKRLSMTLFERRILRDAAAVHFTSAIELKEAEALGLQFRGVVIPLAAESVPAAESGESILLERFPQLRGKRFVLFLSRLDPKKNIEGLLTAIQLCAESYPEVVWVIAGDGPASYTAALREHAIQLDVTDRIVWTGHLDGDIKAAAFQLADLFVLPSYSENFGIAAVEAMQAGLPLVIGKGVALSGQVESAGAGTVVEPVPEAIAAGMRGYLQDPAAIARGGENARALAVTEFSLEKMGARLIDLYESILTSPDGKWQGAIDHG